MSQSLAKLYAHIVFSTKDRFPFLSNKNLKSELHAFHRWDFKNVKFTACGYRWSNRPCAYTMCFF